MKNNFLTKKIDEHSQFTEFLWWCSGANVFLLREAPTDKVKYEGIGGVVLFTSILSFVSSAYAITFISEDILFCLLIGILWAVGIFNLDRYIVSSIEVSSMGKKVASSIPRIILASIISITISYPVKIKIFEKEIYANIKKKEFEVAKERFDYSIDDVNKDIHSEREELSKIDIKLEKIMNLIEKYNGELIKETQGIIGTGIIGRGPAAKVIEEAAKRIYDDEEKLKKLKDNKEKYIEEYLKKRDEIKKKYIDEKNYIDNKKLYDHRVGMLAKIQSLEDLKKMDRSVYWADLFIFSLFLMLELSPVIVKLMAQRGDYDNKLISFNEVKNKECDLAKEYMIEKYKFYYDRKMSKEKNIIDLYIDESLSAKSEILTKYIDKWKNGELMNVVSILDDQNSIINDGHGKKYEKAVNSSTIVNFRKIAAFSFFSFIAYLILKYFFASADKTQNLDFNATLAKSIIFGIVTFILLLMTSYVISLIIVPSKMEEIKNTFAKKAIENGSNLLVSIISIAITAILSSLLNIEKIITSPADLISFVFTNYLGNIISDNKISIDKTKKNVA